MKQYRLKRDIDEPGLLFIPKGTFSSRHTEHFIFFKHEGPEFAFARTCNDLNDWLEEVRKEGACFTHEDLREAFNARRRYEYNLDKLEQEFKFKTFEEYLGSRGHSRD